MLILVACIKEKKGSPPPVAAGNLVGSVFSVFSEIFFAEVLPDPQGAFFGKPFRDGMLRSKDPDS